jgi:sugar/nucleoside kinase (ribokinase family)
MLDESIFRGTRLCVVGSICRDLRTAPISPGEHLFHDGETPTGQILDTIGGGAANSALAAAGLGADVRFAGKVGDDPLGTQLEKILADRKVRSFVRRDPAVSTGSSLALNYTTGHRHFICWQPNNYTLAYSDLDPAVLDGGGHLLRGDVWFAEPMLRGGNAQLFEGARQRGLTTSLDLNWDPQWNSAPAATIRARKEAVRQVLPLVDLVHGNVRELSRFADCEELVATLERLTAWGAGAVVVHLGAEGAGYYSRGQWLGEPAAPVRQHVNSTGCGDLLSVCFMLLYDRKEIPVAEKLKLANRIVAEYIEGRRAL